VSLPLRRARITQPGRPTPTPRGVAAAAPILDLHRLAGNRAVAGLIGLQRNVGWSDAS
jgi:hypothetical protein